MTTSLSSLSSSGISGGLDVQSIVDNLMLAERVPITRLQSKISTYESKISAYQTFNSKLLALKTSAESILFNGESVPLNIPDNFSDRLDTSIFAGRTASSSDEAVVTATADKGIVTGNYSVTVSNLAKFSTQASNKLASATETHTQTGTLTIQKGTDAAVDIEITSENNTLQGIKDAINAKDAGFTASILNDGSAENPYRLVITANNSGSASDLTLTTDWNEDPELSELTFTETVQGEDAALQVNGIDITSSSNSVTNAIEGLTLNLKAESGSAIISTERATDAIVAGVTDFIEKYNDIISYITAQTTYNATTETAGVLAGDYNLRDVQSKLSTAVAQSITSGSGALTVLSQIGITLQNDGMLALNESLFTQKLSSDYEGTARLFLAEGLNSAEETTSFMPLLQQQLDAITDSIDGPMNQAEDLYQQSIDRLNEQIDAIELRLETRREMLVAQYTRANDALVELSSLETTLSGMLNTLTQS